MGFSYIILFLLGLLPAAFIHATDARPMDFRPFYIFCTAISLAIFSLAWIETGPAAIIIAIVIAAHLKASAATHEAVELYGATILDLLRRFAHYVYIIVDRILVDKNEQIAFLSRHLANAEFQLADQNHTISDLKEMVKSAESQKEDWELWAKDLEKQVRNARGSWQGQHASMPRNPQAEQDKLAAVIYNKDLQIQARDKELANLATKYEQDSRRWQRKCTQAEYQGDSDRKEVERLRNTVEQLRQKEAQQATELAAAKTTVQKAEAIVELMHQFADGVHGPQMRVTAVWVFNGLVNLGGIALQTLGVDPERLDILTSYSVACLRSEPCAVIPEDGLRQRSNLSGIKLVGTTMVDTRRYGVAARELFKDVMSLKPELPPAPTSLSASSFAALPPHGPPPPPSSFSAFPPQDPPPVASFPSLSFQPAFVQPVEMTDAASMGIFQGQQQQQHVEAGPSSGKGSLLSRTTRDPPAPAANTTQPEGAAGAGGSAAKRPATSQVVENSAPTFSAGKKPGTWGVKGTAQAVGATTADPDFEDSSRSYRQRR